MRISVRHFGIVLACWLAVLVGLPPMAALAQSADKATSPKVDLLLNLLGDSDIQDWLKTQKPAHPTPAAAKPTSPDADLAAVFTRLHNHISDLVSALPRLPGEVAGAFGLIGGEMN
jgi:hypothetical protein